MRILVTGGRGFIGSHFVDACLNRGYEVIDVDKGTYAANLTLPWDGYHYSSITEEAEKGRLYTWVQQDINDLEHIPVCDFVVNFAAESHVCNSISSSEIFMKSNVMGTHHILELLRGKQHKVPTLIHISTDEVYGDQRDRACVEDDQLLPGNPYSASKSAAEMLVTGYHETYRLPYVITRSSNNYGERQYEEKLIPRCIYELERGRRIPIHGSGKYARDWLYVRDNIEAILSIMDNIGKCVNQTFNIGSNNHLDNLQVAENIVGWIHPNSQAKLDDYIEFIPNRLGQDNFYHICTNKLKQYTGWEAKYVDGLHKFI